MSFSLLLPLPLPNQPNHSSYQNSNLNANPSLFPIPHSFPFFSLTHTQRSPTRSNSVHEGRVHWTQNSFKNHRIVPETLVVLTFSTLLFCLRLFSNALLPDFPRRWRNLIAFSAEAELRASSYPWHLWQAIVAYEDRRFFMHHGVDPVGIARAVLSFSSRGGGSTITQQLVKNTFLKNERTLSRKVFEMVLALALERTMSKRRILSCYMNKIYWGHGIYGIKSASIFYFGKHPSLLSLGESAMLAGIIPAPELRSPLRDPSRGKSFQARVLRRMVEVGFLDIETALLVVKQGLHLHVFVSEYADGLLHLSPLPKDGLGVSDKLKQGTDSAFKVVWDWEKESVTWEAWEDMERWSIKLQAIDHIKLQKNILVVVTKWIFRNK
ncbi:uncharacterized protein LOC126728951 isoform X3 [Quercus robur]|uniref:uncharacterized protein LOC126728951 isoform X3 n=1 Tax=Quercus robur TaxID=38942 RepID=UPI00216398CA|nr:uncharacterized protein LOC126728951 isoform X3 [Quercus robur]